MQIYASSPSFLASQSFTVACEPTKRFSLVLFRQDEGEGLTRVVPLSLAGTSGVQWLGTSPSGLSFFLAQGADTPKTYDIAWDWPTVTYRPPSGAPSSAYVAAAFEVDASGNPVDDFGRRIVRRDLIRPYPPDTASMALLVGRPVTPSAGAKIAYVVPIATYHAYNGTGGGCFYGYSNPPIVKADVVTMLRPGGGLGALLGEPPDAYDSSSPRQQFAHWDAKLIRWLKSQQTAGRLPGIDYYTDLDLHLGFVPLSAYQALVSAGHHEYWSGDMRDHVQQFLQAGGNYACFSGNTCFRPVNFGSYRQPDYNTSVHKAGDGWPGHDESDLTGLSYAYGGGNWGNYVQGQWINTTRPPYGYTVQGSYGSSWVFAGSGVTGGGTFGTNSYLVGYEADGPKNGDTSRTILAQSPRLQGFQDLFVPGVGAIVVKGPWQASPARGVLFNAGTTDWVRVLTAGGNDARDVAQITSNVLRRFSGVSAGDDAAESAPLLRESEHSEVPSGTVIEAN